MIGTRPLLANDHYPVPGYSTPHREPMARHGGRDDTLHPDPSGIGTEAGYMGRDVLTSGVPYNAMPGLFRRLHQAT
jgi:hypothetical protein